MSAAAGPHGHSDPARPLVLSDPLAQALAAARRAVAPITDVSSWACVDARRAESVAAELYAAYGVGLPSGAGEVWKIGALDAATQQRLALHGPLVAPVLTGALTVDAQDAHVDANDLIAPRLEPEVGILREGTRLFAVPCIELADCRFADWAVPPSCAVADFGMQGRMFFGRPVPPPDRVDVVVSHDGQVVARGGVGWAEIVRRLSMVPADCLRSYVASGSLVPPPRAATGTWVADFGAVGSLRLTITTGTLGRAALPADAAVATVGQMMGRADPRGGTSS